MPEEKDLVKFARDTIAAHFGDDEGYDTKPFFEKFSANQGVFVTLHTYKPHGLRGCIGYPLPVMPLGQAVQQAALSAAFQDPRFPPVKQEELENIVMEVSVLTVPENMTCPAEDRAGNIRIGTDGLIIKMGPYQGLLLPQVAPEHNMSAEEFLEHVAMKAGITPEMGTNPDATLQTFQATIWSETIPKGNVEKKTLACQQ